MKRLRSKSCVSASPSRYARFISLPRICLRVYLKQPLRAARATRSMPRADNSYHVREVIKFFPWKKVPRSQTVSAWHHSLWTLCANTIFPFWMWPPIFLVSCYATPGGDTYHCTPDDANKTGVERMGTLNVDTSVVYYPTYRQNQLNWNLFFFFLSPFYSMWRVSLTGFLVSSLASTNPGLFWLSHLATV